MLQGCDPVNATDKKLEVPAQMLAFPLIAAEGKALTVTTALPVRLVPVQLASLTLSKL